ncbi:MAG: hypothetical protein MZW92_25080, partial [Comamonadaceae bacterium]|nr:hypothetical protein [Comamonadaceae bacterium]
YFVQLRITKVNLVTGTQDSNTYRAPRKPRRPTPGRSLGARGLATRMLVLDTRPAGEQLREFLAPLDV